MKKKKKKKKQNKKYGIKYVLNFVAIITSVILISRLVIKAEDYNRGRQWRGRQEVR
jgi:hypothetical protein